jgi:hypothetical protein
MITWVRSLIGRYLEWRNDTDHLSPVAAEVKPQVLKADISERDLLKQSRGLAKTGEGGAF